MQVIKLEYKGKILYQLRKMAFEMQNKEVSKTLIIGIRKFNHIKNKKQALQRTIEQLELEFTTGRKRKQYSFYMNEKQFNEYKSALNQFKKINLNKKTNEIDLFLLLGLEKQYTKIIDSFTEKI